ncbi:hypothetical protein G4B88_026296 [Cannabis sativa]|uniref:EF-hand domain-containing protein n=1 Tax=Cannabis sativa TaxID=3483 RepID=A0A7J6FXH1_CANSA|nr:hypothetical protein G4B88_026296 [Cannabis sativa]
MVNDLFNMVIGRFNVEGKGSIGRDEFKSLSKEMLMAIALGIGGTPILLVLHQDNLLLIIHVIKQTSGIIIEHTSHASNMVEGT